MDPSELVAACKLYAAACSATAHKLTDPDRKKILLERAQACLTLADQIEKNPATGKPPLPRARMPPSPRPHNN